MFGQLGIGNTQQETPIELTFPVVDNDNNSKVRRFIAFLEWL